MPINIDDVAEFRVQYTVNGQVCFNVLHYKVVITNLALSPQVVMADLVDTGNNLGFTANVIPEMLQFFASNVTIDWVYGQWVFPDRYRAIPEEIGSPGVVAGDCEAQNLQITLTKHGDLAARSNLGAVRLGGLHASYYNDGLLTAAGQTAADDVMTVLAANIANSANDVVLAPAILNKENINTPEDPQYVIVGATDISLWVRKNELRTQRTRTVGRGI